MATKHDQTQLSKAIEHFGNQVEAAFNSTALCNSHFDPANVKEHAGALAALADAIDRHWQNRK